MKKTLAAVVIAAFAFIPVASAQAVSTYGVRILMSGPDVQGSPLTGDFTLETFDAYTPGACPSSLTVGTTEDDCTVSDPAGHGGASSESSDPFTGGTGTRFGTTSWGGSQNWPIVLNEPARYLGFWWSSGSSGNTILFYSGEDLVATMNVTGILNKLTAGTLRSIDNNHDYVSAHYYGNPVDGLAPSQPFVYLNVYAIGGTSFDKIVLQGGGFEIDNLTTSYLEQDPDGSLVDVEFIEGLVEPDDYVPPGGDSSESSGSGSLAATGFEAYSLGVFAIATVLVGTTLVIARRRKVTPGR
jgi:hypothetical protein